MGLSDIRRRLAALEQCDRAHHVFIVFPGEPADGAALAGFAVSHNCCGGGETTHRGTDRAALLESIEAELYATITKGLHVHLLTPFYEQNHPAKLTQPEVTTQ